MLWSFTARLQFHPLLRLEIDAQNFIETVSLLVHTSKADKFLTNKKCRHVAPFR